MCLSSQKIKSRKSVADHSRKIGLAEAGITIGTADPTFNDGSARHHALQMHAGHSARLWSGFGSLSVSELVEAT